MPAARPRTIEDSKSETSSIITSLKGIAAISTTVIPTVTKGKKNASTNLPAATTTTKSTINGTTAVPADLDPNLPRTDWVTIPPHILHTYRHVHHLATPSSHTHPHADLLYKSSRTALRSPSSVLARRRLREVKKLRRNGSQTNGKATVPKEKDRTSDRLNSQHTSAGLALTTQLAENTLQDPMTLRQPQPSLALAVRRHFNAQQLNEVDVLARFLYIVHHSSRSGAPSSMLTAAGGGSGPVAVEGGDGDGRGMVMGSHGREVVRNDGAGGGGELGFRLRFRPT